LRETYKNKKKMMYIAMRNVSYGKNKQNIKDRR
jgi:hypothetical protein